MWKVPPIWEGGEVWILGGGPSLTEQFNIPGEVVRQVANGTQPPSIYSPYMEAIHDKHVIGINVAFLIGTWMDMVFFGDGKFFHQYKDLLAKWPKLKVTCQSGLDKWGWLKCLSRDIGHKSGISKNPGTVSWNKNSGAAAISVAANAGAKRIILLGFDMSLGKTGEQHWHKLYQPLMTQQEAKKLGVIYNRNMPFKRHLEGFPAIARDARERGIEIINASPNSAIQVFPKCKVMDLLT